jgi:predicted nucleic acid-binding protein
VKNNFILDTSALIAFFEDEEGADTVASLLAHANKSEVVLYISFITLTELFYITWQEQDKSVAHELVAQVKALPIRCVESEERLCLRAGAIKAENRLSLGNAFIAATAVIMDARLIHKDPEFGRLNGVIQSVSLPYKSDKKIRP